MPTQGPNGEVNGLDVVIRVSDDDGVTWQTIGSQRGATFNENTAPIDVSSKERREYVGLPGRYTSTVSLEHIYIPTQSGYSRLKSAMRDGTYVRLLRYELGADFEEADAIVTSLSSSFPDNEAAIVSADFQVSGPWAASV